MNNMTLNEMAAFLVEHEISTNVEISLVTTICGWNQRALEDILDVRTGYHCFQQYQEMELLNQ